MNESHRWNFRKVKLLALGEVNNAIFSPFLKREHRGTVTSASKVFQHVARMVVEGPNNRELILRVGKATRFSHRGISNEMFQTKTVIIIIINPLTARVVGAPQMILQPVRTAVFDVGMGKAHLLGHCRVQLA